MDRRYSKTSADQLKRIIGLDYFGFNPETIANGLHIATCRGRVSKEEKDYVGYEYHVSKRLWGEVQDVVSHERLYVDVATGLPVRQEAEERPEQPSVTKDGAPRRTFVTTQP